MMIQKPTTTSKFQGPAHLRSATKVIWSSLSLRVDTGQTLMFYQLKQKRLSKPNKMVWMWLHSLLVPHHSKEVDLACQLRNKEIMVEEHKEVIVQVHQEERPNISERVQSKCQSSQTEEMNQSDKTTNKTSPLDSNSIHQHTNKSNNKTSNNKTNTKKKNQFSNSNNLPNQFNQDHTWKFLMILLVIRCFQEELAHF